MLAASTQPGGQQEGHDKIHSPNSLCSSSPALCKRKPVQVQ